MIWKGKKIKEAGHVISHFWRLIHHYLPELQSDLTHGQNYVSASGRMQLLCIHRYSKPSGLKGNLWLAPTSHFFPQFDCCLLHKGTAVLHANSSAVFNILYKCTGLVNKGEEENPAAMVVESFLATSVRLRVLRMKCFAVECWGAAGLRKPQPPLLCVWMVSSWILFGWGSSHPLVHSCIFLPQWLRCFCVANYNLSSLFLGLLEIYRSFEKEYWFDFLFTVTNLLIVSLSTLNTQI